MGQKVNPISQRIGYIRGWESDWIVDKKDIPTTLNEDFKIRQYFSNTVSDCDINRIVIERIMSDIIVTLYSSRTGKLIGNEGDKTSENVKKLNKIIGKNVLINVIEDKNSALNAKFIVESISQKIKERILYKKAIKQAVALTMRSGALGIKVIVSGRLGGAEMARTECVMEGRVPLHTFRANVNYYCGTALTVYGIIGIKVWIFKDEVFQKPKFLSNDISIVNTKVFNKTNGRHGGINKGSERYNNR